MLTWLPRPRPRQDCVAKARAALSPAMLAAATAAAAAQDGIEIVEADAAAEGGSDPPGQPGAAAAAAAAAGAAAVQFEDRALTRKEEASLLHPLLRLRQACCHPQVRAAARRAQRALHAQQAVAR